MNTEKTGTGYRVLKIGGGVFTAVMLATGSAEASGRLFGYSYEPEVMPKGGIEVEQWVTSRAGKADGRFLRLDMRTEVEYGLTDRLTTALYFNSRHTDSSGVSGRKDTNAWTFDGLSSEWKYLLMDPTKNPFGVVLYGEATSNFSDELELEEKVIIGQTFGPWHVAYNVGIEQEWEFADDETERECALIQSFGVARELGRHWSLGLEARNKQVFFDNLDFRGEGTSAWFLGPCVSYQGDTWWATLSVLPQVWGDGAGTDGHLQLDENEQIEVRLGVGCFF